MQGARQLLDCIEFSFPMGYVGPVFDTTTYNNHPSAVAYTEAIQSYLDKESRCGAMFGLFGDPPFHPWAHVSPLMTRPKSDQGSPACYLGPVLQGRFLSKRVH